MLFVLSTCVEAEQRSQPSSVSCSGSLGEGPIRFYSNGIISLSKIFRRGYLREITFFCEGRLGRNRETGRRRSGGGGRNTSKLLL